MEEGTDAVATTASVGPAPTPALASTPAPVPVPVPTSTPGRPDAGRWAGADDRRRWLVLGVVAVGSVMSTLDTFIVNVAVPSLRRGLHASPGEAELVVTTYSLVYAVLLITGGRLGDLYGRSRVFVVGMVGFTAASAACGVAPSPTFLVVARAVQAAGAAVMVPQAYAVVQQVFRPTERVRAISYLTTAASLAVVLAQLVGGGLIQLDLFGLGWRTVFFVNVPFGVAGVAGALLLLPRTGPERRATVDVGGVALATAALLMVVVPLTEGRDLGWPPWLLGILATSPVVFATFVRSQRSRAARGLMPLVDLALFKVRSFSAGVTLAGFGQMSNAGLFFVLAVYLQSGRGLSPGAAGLAFAPLGVGYMCVALFSPRLSGRFGRAVITTGYVVVGVALGSMVVVLHLAAGGSPYWLVPSVALVGAGQGLVNSPLFATVLSRVRHGHEGAASGVMTTAQQTGSAVGVALEGLVFYSALGVAGAVGSRVAPAVASDAFAGALWLNLAFVLVAVVLVRLLPARPTAGGPARAS
ncbi:MAG TPA: MFS transporter [Acidimicrobiales bacterium]|nr:MFS transporter [Acidimicrobiales bacterium]